MVLTEAEEWRDIPGWSDYQVSNIGRVRRRVARHCAPAGLVRVGYPGDFGHLRLTLRDQDGRRKNFGIHRLVLLAFVGPPPTPKHEPAHWNGNPSDNTLGNLRWATPAENQADKVRHGTSNRGERQHMALLTADQVQQIRRDYAAGYSQAAIGKVYGVSRTCVLAITSGRSWAHLPNAYAAAAADRRPEHIQRNRVYKLDDAAIRDIRQRVAAGESVSSVARLHQVTRGVIRWHASRCGA
jgi:HNH endonuclease/NUMOD4 motif